MVGIFRCVVCHSYTMNSAHCEIRTEDVMPAKYSPHDKMGKYRRQAKEAERKTQGVI